MQKILLTLFVALSFSAGYAQQNNSAAYDTVPPYKRDPNVPAFQILQSDSTWFTKNDLSKNKPVIIIYFNPDCGHCQLIAERFGKAIDKFKDFELVWASAYKSLSGIDSFAINSKLNGLHNVHFGKDTRYYIPAFYRVRYTPFIAAYDKHGKLLQVWEEGVIPEDLLKVYQN